MTYLQLAKWGNSLAVRIPVEYARQMGAKEGDQLSVSLSVDGGICLRPAKWDRKIFAGELLARVQQLPLGSSVVEQMRDEARY